MELLAIRLSWQKTPAKSLVMRRNDGMCVMVYVRLNNNDDPCVNEFAPTKQLTVFSGLMNLVRMN